MPKSMATTPAILLMDEGCVENGRGVRLVLHPDCLQLIVRSRSIDMNEVLETDALLSAIGQLNRIHAN
jgi:hypothetical protein